MSSRTPWCFLLALALLMLPCLASAQTTLQYGDGTADGKRSFGGSGQLIMFDAPKDQMWLNKIEMFGSRYGNALAPDEDFKVYILDGERQIIREIALPYLLWERGNEYWRDLPAPPIQVPQQFGIGLMFNAHQTKGVYVGTEKVADVHSFVWVPGEPGKPLEGEDWMIRATVADAPEGDPKAGDLIVQADGAAFIDQFVSAAGDPLIVTLAGHGQLPKANISSIRMNVVSGPTAGDAVVYLTGGMKVTGTISGLDEKSVRIRVGDAEREIARADIARIDFR